MLSIFFFTASGFRIFRKVGMKYIVTEGWQDTFDAGLKLCKDAGGDLILPQNEQENNALVQMLRVLESPIGWIGITDRKTEGTFLDTDGNALTFTKWHPAEPSNSGNNEHCGMIYRDTHVGLWNDVPCDSKYSIVCEVK